MWRRLSVVLLFLSTAAFGQKQGDLRLTVFTSNPGFTVSSNDADASGGLGVALTYWAGSQWSVELSTAAERHYATRTVLFDGDLARVERFGYTSHPVDLLAQYHFPTATFNRWKPYAGIGAHYVERPREAPDSRTYAAYSGEVNGGIFFHLTPRVALRFDARRLLRTSSPPYDDPTKVAFGIAWRFNQ